MVTVVVPGTLLLVTGPDAFDLWQSYPATRVGLPVIGGVLACLGLVLLVATIRLFVTVGRGTLAPWNPTKRLVVRGVYRHVRNPMIAGVFFALLGEAFLGESLPLPCWFVVFVISNAVYILLAEEPGPASKEWRTERSSRDLLGGRRLARPGRRPEGSRRSMDKALAVAAPLPHCLAGLESACGQQFLQSSRGQRADRLARQLVEPSLGWPFFSAHG
jgi:hypothetical protein